ncbi:MAG: hypothetical protein JNL96_28420 [Planctomycetaceae bacterium]|nr:hypothetical protein [Planctomycetaceae bacterium]
MDDHTTPSRRRRFGLNGPGATIAASLIAGISAVLAATLPNVFAPRHELTATAVAVAAPSATATGSAELAPIPTPYVPNLTHGAFTLCASTDAEGTDFTDSVLKFTSQQPTQEGAVLAGFFEWRDRNAFLGREHFTATYVASSKHLFIEGKTIENVSGTLAVGSFSAKVSDDGRRLTEGTWGSTPGELHGVPGQWEARR